MSYRDDFRDTQKETYWSLPRILLLGFVIFGGIGITGFVLNLISQPGRIISKTFDADNIINNYEWFHDAHGNYRAKVNQIKQHKKYHESEPSGGEKARLRIELAAMQQSCRELTNRYNANADKANRSIFMRGVPEKLNAGECE